MEFLSKYISGITAISYSNLTFSEKTTALNNLKFKSEEFMQDNLKLTSEEFMQEKLLQNKIGT